jgi:cytochrome c oxidase assembly protein subunit 11
MQRRPDSEPAPDPRAAKNVRLAIVCGVIFCGMVGAAFAAVPFYRAFCQATGFAGYVPRASRAPTRVLDQEVVVSFDTNVRGLPWTFAQLQRSQTLKVGATGLAFFTVTNTSSEPLTGRAAYNVAPAVAGAYVRKLQCRRTRR